MAGTTKRKDSNRVVLRKGEGQKPNGTYYYNWTDKNRKRHFVYAKTLAELRQKECEIEEAVNDYAANQPANIRLNDMFSRWLEYKRGLKRNTESHYIWMYDTYVSCNFGKRYIKDIRKSDVRIFYNYLYEKVNLSLSTIENIHTVMRQIFDLAVDDEIIIKNPCDNILKDMKRINDARSAKRTAMTVTQQVKFLKFVQSHEVMGHWYPLLYVLANTGLRIGEAIGLRWDDVDFDNKVVDVNHTLIYASNQKAYNWPKSSDGKAMYFLINTPKTPSGYRQVPMTPGVVEIMKELKETTIPCNMVVEGYTGFIFSNRYGQCMNPSLVNKAILRILRDYNLWALENNEELMPRISCHTFRHTFATRLCESGMNVKAIQEILGHADIRITLEIYTDASREFKETEMNAFVDYMNANEENLV